MKKSIIIICMLAFSVSVWALIEPTISSPITTAGYTAVRLPANMSCTSFSVWTEDGSAYYIASQSNGSDGILTPDEPIYNSDQKHGKSTAGTILFYAKGTTSTNIVGIFKK